MKMTDITFKHIGTGLRSSEIENRRAAHGANYIERAAKIGFFRRYLENFNDPIIKILLGALALNIVLLFKGGNILETLGIAAAVLISTLVSTLSEYSSEKAFEKLQSESENLNCRVRRDGNTITVPLSDIVCGDIVIIGAGEMIPADGILCAGSLTLDQSPLNGESAEVHKYSCTDINSYRGKGELSDRSYVCRGSLSIAGEGEIFVTAVGANTLYGSLAGELQNANRDSPLKTRLSGLAAKLSVIGYAAAALVIAADLFNLLVINRGFETMSATLLLGDILHALTLGITVVVVAVPEGLPMMITVVLSSNMFKMMRGGVMVRKLVGIETAGSMNILFTDKTGTLTCGKLTAVMFVDAGGRKYPAVRAAENNTIQEMAAVCAEYTAAENMNSTDSAVCTICVPKLRSKNVSYIRSSYIPFDSSRKFSAALVSGGRKSVFYAKGAPEKILVQCSRTIAADGKIIPWSDKSPLCARLSELTSRAYRVIALAAHTEITQIGDNLPNGMIFIGLVAIRDELRREAKSAVADIRGAGIQCVMITGDNRETACAIAREVGILSPNAADGDKILTGTELERLGDTEIKKMLPSLRVIARATPTDKTRLVRIADEMGLVCGMTGDGINDAPALKNADVGFALGSGTEVAREAGDIVILDDNLASIVRAVLYGRTIFKSIRKFIVFQLTMNLCAVALSVIGPFIGFETPVTVIQMLWVNLIMDTLAGLAFAGEAPLREYLHEPPKKRNEAIFTRTMAWQVLCTGIYTVLLCFAFLTFPALSAPFRVMQHTQTGDINSNIYMMTGFFALFIFCGVSGSFSARSWRVNSFAHLSKNPMFILIMLCVCVMQIMLMYFGGNIFRCTQLSPEQLKWVILLALSVIPADFLRKIVLRIFGKNGAF